ncbi:MAG: RNA polymerase sigma factor [Patescibacteria group bacterium]
MNARQLRKFEGIAEEHQKSIVNFHYRFVGDRYEAENLAQDTFIKAFLKLKTLKDKKKLKSWLFAIARNVVIDFFRKNKNREIALGNEMIENFIETASSVKLDSRINEDEISRELQRCIDQLSSQDRRLIKLLYYEGFSYKEISQILRINQNTLKSRLHRTRAILLEIIQQNDLLKDVAMQYK